MKKIPLSHRHYNLFSIDSISGTSREVWLNPATIYEIKDGSKKQDFTLSHTINAVTFAVDISRRTLMHRFRLILFLMATSVAPHACPRHHSIRHQPFPRL